MKHNSITPILLSNTMQVVRFSQYRALDFQPHLTKENTHKNESTCKSLVLISGTFGKHQFLVTNHNWHVEFCLYGFWLISNFSMRFGSCVAHIVICLTWVIQYQFLWLPMLIWVAYLVNIQMFYSRIQSITLHTICLRFKVGVVGRIYSRHSKTQMYSGTTEKENIYECMFPSTTIMWMIRVG